MCSSDLSSPAWCCHWLCLALLFSIVDKPVAAETPSESTFKAQVKRLEQEEDTGRRIRQAKEMVERHSLSSVQVKAIAEKLRNDEARLEFAWAAYRRVVDPENFYEVYDAFTTFSKVMRLHDRVRRLDAPRHLPMALEPQVVPDEEMPEILAAIKKEGLDDNRLAVARQILNASSRKFRSTQIRDIVKCLTFEDRRLECAKFALPRVFDADKYFVVNEAFTFSATRDELAQYIESLKPGDDERRPASERKVSRESGRQ